MQTAPRRTPQGSSIRHLFSLLSEVQNPYYLSGIIQHLQIQGLLRNVNAYDGTLPLQSATANYNREFMPSAHWLVYTIIMRMPADHQVNIGRIQYRHPYFAASAGKACKP